MTTLIPMVTYGSESVEPCGWTEYRWGPVESTPPSTRAALIYPWYLSTTVHNSSNNFLLYIILLDIFT